MKGDNNVKNFSKSAFFEKKLKKSEKNGEIFIPEPIWKHVFCKYVF